MRPRPGLENRLSLTPDHPRHKLGIDRAGAAAGKDARTVTFRQTQPWATAIRLQTPRTAKNTDRIARQGRRRRGLKGLKAFGKPIAAADRESGGVGEMPSRGRHGDSLPAQSVDAQGNSASPGADTQPHRHAVDLDNLTIGVPGGEQPHDRRRAGRAL